MLLAPQAAAASSGGFAAEPASPRSPEAELQARGTHRLRPLNRRTDRGLACGEHALWFCGFVRRSVRGGVECITWVGVGIDNPMRRSSCDRVTNCLAFMKLFYYLIYLFSIAARMGTRDIAYSIIMGLCIFYYLILFLIWSTSIYFSDFYFNYVFNLSEPDIRFELPLAVICFAPLPLSFITFKLIKSKKIIDIIDNRKDNFIDLIIAIIIQIFCIIFSVFLLIIKLLI